MRNINKFVATVSTCALLAGCGVTVPPIQEIWDKPPGTDGYPIPLESDIKYRVFCDIKDAVYDVLFLRLFGPNGPSLEELGAIETNYKNYLEKLKDKNEVTLLDMGIQVSLTLTIDETSGLSPGLAINTPMAPATTVLSSAVKVVTPQSYAFGLGGNLSSHATRIDKFNFYTTVEQLFKRYKEKLGDPAKYPEGPRCDPNDFRQGSSLLLQSDLRIPE